ncbi:MAG: PAS domain S-box protein [Muricomes sp.]
MNVAETNNITPTLPLGIIYLKLPENSLDEIRNYVLLDINPAFKEMLEIYEENVVNKKVSEIFEQLDFDRFSWIAYMENAVCSGKTQETVQWMDKFKQYFRITVIPADNTAFMVVLQYTSEEAGAAARKEEMEALPVDLDLLFNNTHDAVSLVESGENGFQYVLNNIVHQRLTGFSNVRGLPIFRVVGWEVAQKLSGYYEECINTGNPISYEQAFSFAPGNRIWQTEVTPVFVEGRVRYLLCSSKDISELKSIRRKNEVLTNRFKAMFEQHSALKVVFEAGTGKIVDVNPAICRYFGYSREELLEHSIQEYNLLPVQLQNEKMQNSVDGEILFLAAPYRLKSGETRLLDVYTSPVTDGDERLLFAILFDVTDRVNCQNELLQEKERLQTTLYSIGDAVVTTDRDGIVTSLNIVAEELTGWNSTEAVGRAFTELLIMQNEETKEKVEDPVQKVIKTGRISGLANHTELVNRYGKRIPIVDSAAPIKTKDGQMHGVVMVFHDVSGEKEHSRQIEYLSYHDHLTGLYNRRYIEEQTIRLDTADNLPISIIMGDVNGLKIINDAFGHEAGDVLLKRIALLFEENCRSSDLIARWGGDEFVVLMPQTCLDEAEEITRKLRTVQIPIHDISLPLSLSLGCASKNKMEISLRDTMREAEGYMYHQKLLDSKSYRNTIISALLATLHEKSNETEEHSERIKKYCYAIGEKLKLTAKDMDILSLLALLHDIGNVSIAPEILRKQGSLTPEEWDELKRHPEIGYRIAQTTPDLNVVADFILSHHERWDGKGYPRGLKGDEIPLVCRILAVVDAFDALTNDRVYRKAGTAGDAILELERNAGTQFDPHVVDLMIQLILSEEREDRL